MIDYEFNNECHIFLCYRSGGAEIAKNFKKALANTTDRHFGYVWYSDQENIGNFVQDIKSLTSSAKYAILFFEKNFTKDFLLNGKNNYGNEKEGKIGCVTVREIVEIERRRQTGDLTVVGVHIDGYLLQPHDLDILKQVFQNEGILTPSSLTSYTELNQNVYFPRTTDVDVFASTLSRGMEKRKVSGSEKTPKVNIDALVPPLGYHYYGRECVFDQMDLMRETKSCINIVAPGGNGKSSFIFHWLSRIAPHQYYGAEYILYWSFKRESPNSAISFNLSDFLEYVLSFFGISNAKELSTELEKATALSSFIQEHSTLLILDGMDVFQCREQGKSGMLQNQSIKKLISSVCRSANHKNSLLLLLSNTPIADLQFYSNQTAVISLPPITSSDGVKILRDLGVSGSEHELNVAVNELHCDPMSITLLGKILTIHYNGNIHERYRVRYTSERVEQAEQILSFYETMWPFNTKEGVVLLLCCLFSHDADYESLKYLLDQSAHIPALALAKSSDLHGIIRKFREVGLAYGQYDVKILPAVKEYYRGRFKKIMPEVFCQCNLILGKYYASLCADENVTTVAEMLPLYDAVFYYNQADDPNTAVSILWERIFRKRQFFSQKQLGATTNDFFAISLFFDISNDWTPNPKLSNIDTAWLCSVAAYLQKNMGNLRESEILRRREIRIYETLGHHLIIASDRQNLAQNLLLQGKLDESEQEFIQALSALETGASQICEANPYAKDINIEQLRTNILSRYAYLLFLRGKSSWKKANEKLDMLDATRLKVTTTGMFDYCYIRLHTSEVKKQRTVCDEIVNQYLCTFNQNKKHEIAYVNFLLAQIAFMQAKGIKRRKYLEKSMSYANLAIQYAKSAGRMDQLPFILNEMLSLYLSIFEQERVENHRRKIRLAVESVINDLEETFSLYDLPIYKIDYLFLKARYHLIIDDPNEAYKLYIALNQSSICIRYFSSKLKNLRALLIKE